LTDPTPTPKKSYTPGVSAVFCVLFNSETRDETARRDFKGYSLRNLQGMNAGCTSGSAVKNARGCWEKERVWRMEATQHSPVPGMKYSGRNLQMLTDAPVKTRKRGFKERSPGENLRRNTKTEDGSKEGKVNRYSFCKERKGR